MSNVKDTARYAGFWVRLVAFIIDLVITGVILTPLWVWYFIGLTGTESGLYLLGYAPYVVLPVCLLVPLVYFAGFWTWRGQTPGKMAMRIRILRTNDNPLGLGRAVLRYLGYLTCFGIIWLVFMDFLGAIRFIGLIGLIGFIIIAFQKQKRGLPDIIAGTCVVVKARGSDIA